MRRLLALTILVLIVSCSGDNGTAPKDDNHNGGGGGGGAVTKEDSLRVQTLQTLATQLEAWDGQSPDSIAVHALAYLKGLPSVKHAGITPGTTTVWANFTGGFDLIIPNNRDTSTMADTLVDPPSAGVAPARSRSAAPIARRTTGPVPARKAAVPTSALELPEVATFRAVNAIGTCHINPLPGIKALLTRGNYTDANPGLPTVSQLKHVSGDGVFYINSHGGAGFDANQVAYYAVWTLDPIDLATLANYKPMVDSHELVGMLETSNDALGNCAKVMHYGFTSKFVRNHMSFAKNSLVIVDACFSSSGPAADMRAAFGAKGASVYVGWSRAVNAPFAYAAMKYLIDRLLGINEITPESPKQRAFNIDDVRKDMETNRNLVTDPFANAVLTVSKLGGDFGLLSPSIQFLSLEDDKDGSTLVIAGMFGSDPGGAGRAVTINGQAMSILSWEPTLIRCVIDTEGPNAAGTVAVQVGTGANPRRSNPVNITEWKGELTYSRDDPGDQAVNATMRVHFRADIHSFRDEPHEPPFETTVLFNAMPDASADVVSSGSIAIPQGDCLDTYKFSGSVHLPSPYGTSPNGGWMYFGSVDTLHHKLQLNLRLFTLFHVGDWIRSGPAECAPFTQPMYGTIAVDNCLFDEVQSGLLTAFDMPMSDTYEVSADGRGPCQVNPLVVALVGYTAESSAHWNAMTPTHLPDPDAAR